MGNLLALMLTSLTAGAALVGAYLAHSTRKAVSDIGDLRAVMWSGAAYGLVRLAFVWPEAPAPWVVAAGPAAVAASAAIGWSWAVFARRTRRVDDAASRRWEAVLLVLGVLCSLAACVPGLVFRWDVFEHEIGWLDLTYRVPGLGTMPILSLLPGLSAAILVLRLRVIHRDSVRVGSLFVLVVLVNEVLAASRVVPTPRLGEILILGIVAGTLARVSAAAHERARQSLATRDEMLEIAQRRLVEQRRLAELGQLAASVGHEINNPLTYIIGNLEHVAEEANLTGDEAASIADALHGAERIAHIVSDLRLLAHRPTSREQSSCDLSDVVDAVVRGLPPPERSRVRSWVAGEHPVLGAAERLQQVFGNLVDNGLDSSPDACVTISVESTGDSLRCVVEDDGPGISKETLARIFEPFFTTKGHGGTGLGLPIVSNLVEQLGGTLEIESVVGLGTRATVTLPMAEHARVMARTTESVPIGPCRVLLVEDDPKVSASVARMLFDHDLVVVDRLEVARSVLRDRTFDVIVSDVGLPDGTGLELIPTVRAPLLFITGGVVDEAVRGSLLESKLPWLEKPFSSAELRRMVRHTMSELPARPPHE